LNLNAYSLYRHGAVFFPAKEKLATAHKLKASGLEYTLVSNGFFMDYYGLPKVKSYLQPLVFAVNLATPSLVPVMSLWSSLIPLMWQSTWQHLPFPRTGLSKVSSSVIRLTWNELVALAETTKGW
jgi:uncharacterized membrane protein